MALGLLLVVRRIDALLSASLPPVLILGAGLGRFGCLPSCRFYCLGTSPLLRQSFPECLIPFQFSGKKDKLRADLELLIR